jgi:hypothetical protein
VNVWAVTYEFNGQSRTLLVENNEVHKDDVLVKLHPSIRLKFPTIEYVGTLA